MNRRQFAQLSALAAFDHGTTNAEEAPYKERHRPRFHFSPKRGWTNDPNGLVYYQGEYHLFMANS